MWSKTYLNFNKIGPVTFEICILENSWNSDSRNRHIILFKIAKKKMCNYFVGLRIFNFFPKFFQDRQIEGKWCRIKQKLDQLDHWLKSSNLRWKSKQICLFVWASNLKCAWSVIIVNKYLKLSKGFSCTFSNLTPRYFTSRNMLLKNTSKYSVIA